MDNKFRRIAGMLAFAGLALTANLVQAHSVNLGTLDQDAPLADAEYIPPDEGVFDITYTFKVDEAVPAANIEVENLSNAPFEFTSLNATLEDPDGNILGSGSALNSSWTFFLSSAVLDSFDEHLKYRLIIDGAPQEDALGGIFSVAMTAVPVPISILLLGSGLIGLAAVGRRRQS